MWIPKNPPGGIVTKIFVGVASLALVHVTVIVAHTLLDETQPLDVAYPLDRIVEPVELVWARIWGKDDATKFRLRLAEERIEELEALVHSEKVLHMPEETRELLFDRLFADSLSMIRSALVDLDTVQTDNPHTFALIILSQSTLEDIVARVENVKSDTSYLESMNTKTDIFLLSVRLFIDANETILAGFTIEENVRSSILREVEQRRASLNLLDESDGECGNTGSDCSHTSDCCEGSGLACMPFQSSDGYTKRCQKQAVRICIMDCVMTDDLLAWGRAHRCSAGYRQDGMPSCDSVFGMSCTSDVNETTQTCWQE